MTRLLRFTNGTDFVDIINTAKPGMILARGGGGRNSINPILTFTSSALVDGANLKTKKYPPVVDTYRINLKGTSHDNAADQIQALQRILIDADDEQTTDWQQVPIYIEQQTTGETNTRYSKILSWSSFEFDDWFNHPFEIDSEQDGFVVIVVREPFWRSHPPGVMPDREPLRSANFPYFDETTATDPAINGDAAIDGDWGAEFVTDGASSQSIGKLKEPQAQTALSIKFKISGASLTMPTTSSVRIAQDDATDTLIIFYRESGGVREVAARAIDDSAANFTTAFFAAPDNSEILVEWKAATAPAADDGELRLSIDSVLKETIPALDNDTKTISTMRFGVMSVPATIVGSLFMDTIELDDASPFATARRTVDFEELTQFVSNFRQTTPLTHIFNEDNSLAAFSANLVAEPEFEYFVVSGSTPALDDAVYFGADGPFFQIVLNVIVGQVSTGVSFVSEYFNGSTWTTIVNGVIFSAFSGGHSMFSFAGASDWGKTTINGENKLWLRVRIGSVTSFTTAPKQGDHLVFLANDSWFEFNENQLMGEMVALTLTRVLNYGSANSEDINWLTIGAKTRGLENFTSRLNAGGQNPPLWTETYFDDTTQTADPTAPGGNNAKVTFVSNIGLLERLRITISNTEVENDLEGSYRIYMRARQVGGSAGDVSAQLILGRSTTQDGDVIKSKQADGGIEVFDLGVFSIQKFGIRGDETEGNLEIRFSIWASATSSTPNLEIHDLVLIPIDEFSMNVKWSNRAFQGISSSRGLQIDSGILRESALQFIFSGANDVFGFLVPLSEWEVHGKLPTPKPRRATRIYFLFAFENTTTGVLEASNGQGTGIQYFAHEQWLTLRGADG